MRRMPEKANKSGCLKGASQGLSGLISLRKVRLRLLEMVCLCCQFCQKSEQPRVRLNKPNPAQFELIIWTEVCGNKTGTVLKRHVNEKKFKQSTNNLEKSWR